MSLALHVLGLCLTNQSKYDDAARVLQEALELRLTLGPDYKESTPANE